MTATEEPCRGAYSEVADPVRRTMFRLSEEIERDMWAPESRSLWVPWGVAGPPKEPEWKGLMELLR